MNNRYFALEEPLNGGTVVTVFRLPDGDKIQYGIWDNKVYEKIVDLPTNWEEEAEEAFSYYEKNVPELIIRGEQLGSGQNVIEEIYNPKFELFENDHFVPEENDSIAEFAKKRLYELNQLDPYPDWSNI